jgi:hypothetical protein
MPVISARVAPVAPQVVPVTLPAATLGRAQQLAHLVEALLDPAVSTVAVSGPPGSGKFTLMCEAIVAAGFAHTVMEVDGQWSPAYGAMVMRRLGATDLSGRKVMWLFVRGRPAQDRNGFLRQSSFGE